ncbi:hypothetical protein TNCV_1446651 [Trichonephila clavipes]|nr:hypothetical protein TNCV_1446651 [Trichonephila clavipes]
MLHTDEIDETVRFIPHLETHMHIKHISLPSSSMAKLWRWRSVVSPSIVKKSNLSHRLGQHSFLPFGNFTELNRTIICMVLKAKANDRRTSSLLP